jgi:ABC-type sulfate transport system substrate-binding protein
MNFNLHKSVIAILLLMVMILTGCSGGNTQTGDDVQLTLAAYTTPREAYAQIIPAFQTKNPTWVRARNLAPWLKGLRPISSRSRWKQM